MIVSAVSRVSPEVQARLGTPLFTTRRSLDGTGFGWGLCREIVKEHRGRIELESRSGIGTTIRVLLPRVSNAGAKPGN